MHVKDASEQRDFTLGVPRPNTPDHDISHDFCGPMQYSGPQTTSTTARPLTAPSNTAVYGYSPYAAPFLSHAGARPSSFALSALPGVAGNQPPYPPHPAIPPPPLDTHDHGYSAQSNHMANHQLYSTLSNMSHTLPASSTYHEGYPSPLDFPLNEHGLPALIGEEDRQPFSNDATPEPVSRSSSMDSAGSMDDMQLVDLQRLPQYLYRGRGVESTHHPSAVNIHRAPEFPGDARTRLNEHPYAPDGGPSHHPPSLYNGQVPPIAPADDAQPASHMPSSYTQFDGAGQQRTTAAYASTMAQYGQYDHPTVRDEERSMSMSHDVVHPPSIIPVGSERYLQSANGQQPMHEVPSGGHSSSESLTTLPRSLRRGLAIRQSGTVTAGNEHRYTPYGGAAQRELPPVPNAQFGSVGQYVQPHNNLKPRQQSQHTAFRTGSFSGYAMPTASQGVIYGSTPPSGPSAGISYENRHGAATTVASGGETKASSTRPPNDQLPATSTIGGGTQYQWIGGPTSRQREWQSDTRHIANVPAPTQTPAGLATRDLAMPFAHLPRLEPSASLSSANRAAASSSHVASALADGVAGVAPAALVHSFQVVPAPSAPQPLIGVQPDPKCPEHADPQRPWLVGDDGSKADRIKKFIADEAERTGHDTWPRMCPHSDCKTFLQWLDGGRAKQPVYQDEDALLRHIERCGDEVCEFCFVEGAFFGRPALAHTHRAGRGRKGCPTMQKCGGVRNIVGVYAWLEKHCTVERIEQVVASYQLGEKVRNGKPFGKYTKILHADVLGGNVTARALVDTARMALDADDIPAFAVQYSMPA